MEEVFQNTCLLQVVPWSQAKGASIHKRHCATLMLEHLTCLLVHSERSNSWHLSPEFVPKEFILFQPYISASFFIFQMLELGVLIPRLWMGQMEPCPVTLIHLGAEMMRTDVFCFRLTLLVGRFSLIGSLRQQVPTLKEEVLVQEFILVSAILFSLCSMSKLYLGLKQESGKTFPY